MIIRPDSHWRRLIVLAPMVVFVPSLGKATLYARSDVPVEDQPGLLLPPELILGVLPGMVPFMDNPSAGGGGGAGPRTVYFLTTTSSATWSVPVDWYNADNTIEAIGGGGRGGAAASSTARCGGGGGAEYRKYTNMELTPGGTVQYGAGSSANPSWFNGTSSSNALLRANSGSSVANNNDAGALGGGSGTGGTGFIGGRGLSGDSANGSGGGGGAAGPNGNGLPQTSEEDIAGGDGDNGLGGAGAESNGQQGGNGTNAWVQTSNSATAGSGGGGAGRTTTGNGGNGGLYGGGGGGACRTTSGSASGGNGGQGIIVATNNATNV